MLDRVGDHCKGDKLHKVGVGRREYSFCIRSHLPITFESFSFIMKLLFSSGSRFDSFFLVNIANRSPKRKNQMRALKNELILDTSHSGTILQCNQVSNAPF